MPGTAPPQKPTSTQTRSRATARFSSSAATVVVAGMLLSGMSTMVVTPPAAAARVAVSNPSHSVRPGSLTCTWVSTSPGSSTSSSSELDDGPQSPASLWSSYPATEAIRPPRIPIAARRLAAVHDRAPGPDQDVELSSHGRSSSRSGLSSSGTW